MYSPVCMCGEPPPPGWLWNSPDGQEYSLGGSRRPPDHSLHPKMELGKERGRHNMMRAVPAPMFTERGVGPRRSPTGIIIHWFERPEPWPSVYSSAHPGQDWSQPYVYVPVGPWVGFLPLRRNAAGDTIGCHLRLDSKKAFH